MENATVFQFAASGRRSNIEFNLIGAVFLVVIVFCLWYVVRAVKELRRDADHRAEWKSAAGTIVEIATSVFFAVLAGLSGGGYGASTGIATGAASDAKKTKGSNVAICLLAAIVFSVVLVSTTFYEQPLQVAVSPQRVSLLYRLPWRNRSIPIGRITRVDLVRYEDRSDHSYYYNLLIYHDGKALRIICDTPDWYEAQLKAAYEAIEGQLKLRDKQRR